jgi:hypothetical protein
MGPLYMHNVHNLTAPAPGAASVVTQITFKFLACTVYSICQTKGVGSGAGAGAAYYSYPKPNLLG